MKTNAKTKASALEMFFDNLTSVFATFINNKHAHFFAKDFKNIIG